MSDSEKPFACTEPGCSMSFTNEDHLTVHKKKHDMMLNLGINNKNIFFIDQTPTPTRFIRSCEEVGLFQDLQNDHDHDNPFEQTFRRAVEAGKNGGLTVPEIIEDSDSLHTPNVFPPIREECTTSITSVSTKNQVTKTEIKSLTETSTIIQTVSSKEMKIEDFNVNEHNNHITIGAIGTLMNEDAIVQSTPSSSSSNDSTVKSGSIEGTEMQLLLKTQDGKILKLVAAPMVDVLADKSQTQVVQPIVDKGASVTSYNLDKHDQKKIQGAALKMKLKQTVLTKNNGMVAENRKNQNFQNENKPKEHLKDKIKRNSGNVKKQAILERNRASSMRARAKKKAWIEQLQQSLKLANEKYNNLQNQVKNLHGQVEKLKSLLLAHKDCPVTKAMEKENGIIVSSKVMTINPDDTKTVKRTLAMKPVSPPKKLMIMSASKNPVILPKIDTAANSITLHGVDAVKTIPAINIASNFITTADATNTILITPDSGNVSLVQKNVGFAVINNYEQNNVSKTSGS